MYRCDIYPKSDRYCRWGLRRSQTVCPSWSNVEGTSMVGRNGPVGFHSRRTFLGVRSCHKILLVKCCRVLFHRNHKGPGTEKPCGCVRFSRKHMLSSTRCRSWRLGHQRRCEVHMRGHQRRCEVLRRGRRRAATLSSSAPPRGTTSDTASLPHGSAARDCGCATPVSCAALAA